MHETAHVKDGPKNERIFMSDLLHCRKLLKVGAAAELAVLLVNARTNKAQSVYP